MCGRGRAHMMMVSPASAARSNIASTMPSSCSSSSPGRNSSDPPEVHTQRAQEQRRPPPNALAITPSADHKIFVVWNGILRVHLEV